MLGEDFLKDWWEKKKKKSRRHKKGRDNYTFWDFLFDIALWLPEVLILPLRIIYWIVRSFARNIFDAF